MATDVIVANMALVILGGVGDLTDLNAANPRAEKVRAVYPTLKKALLESHPWNFALERARLSAQVDASGDPVRPAFGWQYQYILPGNCLRVWRLNDAPIERVPRVRERGKLLTNVAGPINLRYIADVPEAEWSALFTAAAAAVLAADLALAITATASAMERAQRAAVAKLREARWADAQENGRLEMETGPLEGAHRAVAGGTDAFADLWRESYR